MNEDPHNIECRIEAKQPLAPMTTLGVGGESEYYFVAETVSDLIAACRWAKGRALPVRVLSGGSNLVIADTGVAGLTIDLRTKGIQFELKESRVMVTAASGENWDALVEMVAERGYCGLECLSGIPGRVGATPIQNVGAYGQDVAQSVAHVDAYDLLDDSVVRIGSSECEFAYRNSRFRARESGRYVILSVCYELRRNASPVTGHAELTRLLKENGVTQPTTAELRRAVLTLRRSKSMVLDPSNPWSRSCGSFFVNPVVSEVLAEEIRSRCGTQHVPLYSLPEGGAKIAAAWLIERAGFSRGHRDGPVGLSGGHSLAIVAYDQASARDVCDLGRRIQDAVLQQFGVELLPEPVFWGYSTFRRGLPE
jgi:UDP-N-acetylmuramate dehydrogenase